MTEHSDAHGIPRQFVIERQGREFVLYGGLLDLAHRRGLQAIETELIELPSAENGHTAIFKATVRMGNGATFTGYADANPENVNKNVRAHVLRVAETRAKARALRDAVNVQAEVEGDVPASDALGVPRRESPPRRTQSAIPPPPRPAPPAMAPSAPKPAAAPASRSERATPKQLDAIRNLARQKLGLDDDDEIDGWLLSSSAPTLDRLTAGQAEQAIKGLSQMPARRS